ncbi:hypothetical protein NPIL_318671 [Nephila pilipes]|uniref:Uncharacterized protein n=1 Tax=Nephila pilipes TaxID=299642 RepID=A0A8X6NJK3_NEPPI|nr:hypothetical protein NPIL_318671 [Nephila pilipes]
MDLMDVLHAISIVLQSLMDGESGRPVWDTRMNKYMRGDMETGWFNQPHILNTFMMVGYGTYGTVDSVSPLMISFDHQMFVLTLYSTILISLFLFLVKFINVTFVL